MVKQMEMTTKFKTTHTLHWMKQETTRKVKTSELQDKKKKYVIPNDWMKPPWTALLVQNINEQLQQMNRAETQHKRHTDWHKHRVCYHSFTKKEAYHRSKTAENSKQQMHQAVVSSRPGIRLLVPLQHKGNDGTAVLWVVLEGLLVPFVIHHCHLDLIGEDPECNPEPVTAGTKDKKQTCIEQHLGQHVRAWHHLKQASLWHQVLLLHVCSSVLPQASQQTEAPMLHHKAKQENHSPNNVLNLNTRKHNVWLCRDKAWGLWEEECHCPKVEGVTNNIMQDIHVAWAEHTHK